MKLCKRSNVYPRSEINSTFEHRSDALDALIKDKIAAYASDEIILLGILEKGNFDPTAYSIVPISETLSHDECGIVVYNNEELLQSINRWIKSQKGKDAKAEIEQLVKNNQLEKILEFLKIELPKIPWLFFFLIIVLSILIISTSLFLFPLAKLSQIYPTNTTAEQMIVAAKAIEQIENNPTLKQRLINAAKEGGLEAFGKILDNPVGAFIVGVIKGWQET